MIKTYLITLEQNYCENELQRYGVITYKSTIMEGLYFLESEYKREDLEKLHFVKSVEDNYSGKLCK